MIKTRRTCVLDSKLVVGSVRTNWFRLEGMSRPPLESRNDLRAMLDYISLADQMQVLGERLYPLIDEFVSRTRAHNGYVGRIAGMMLEGLDADALLDMIYSPQDLEAGIDVAMQALERRVPVDLARIQPMLARMESRALAQSEAGEARAVDSDIAGKSCRADWKRDELVREFQDYPCFADNPRRDSEVVEVWILEHKCFYPAFLLDIDEGWSIDFHASSHIHILHDQGCSSLIPVQVPEWASFNLCNGLTFISIILYRK